MKDDNRVKDRGGRLDDASTRYRCHRVLDGICLYCDTTLPDAFVTLDCVTASVVVPPVVGRLLAAYISRRQVSEDDVAPPCHLSYRMLTESFDQRRIFLRRYSYFSALQGMPARHILGHFGDGTPKMCRVER